MYCQKYAIINKRLVDSFKENLNGANQGHS